MKLGYAINYAKRIRPGSAFPDEVYIQWINQIEGLVQTDVWMLFAEDVLSYHENAEKGGAGVSFPDDKTLRFESDPGFYTGGEVVLSGFSTYAANNASAARTILKRSADGLSYEFADGTFAAVGTEPEESAAAAVSYTEYGKELLVPKPHDKLYLSYLLAMIDLANAETRNYANSITVFNEDYQEYSGYYGLNVNPADGRAEFKGYYISAYSIARKNGFTGTEQEWLKSLEGGRGSDGAPGAPIVIRDMYGTLDELKAAVTTPNLGDMYAVGTESENVVYFWNGTTWVGLGAVRGADGAPGIAGEDGTSATIRIGTVSTGAAGSSAQVTNSGTENAAVLNFVIPRGADGTNGAAGKDGESATIRVGTVSTGAAGSSAQVTNGGTESAAVLNFVIPRGADGVDGAAGSDGVGISAVAFKETDAFGNNVYTITLTNGATYDFTAPKGATGQDGEDFQILGYYDTLSALTAAVTAPTAGDAYGVGTTAPYEIYVFDGVSGTWKNNGTIQGPAGKDGVDGVDGTDGREVELQVTSTYIQWRYAGETTWKNLIALSSLEGSDGKDGKSAYTAAQEGGYTGAEAEFNAALASAPGHIADTDIHVAAEEKTAWSAKQDALSGTQGQVVGFDAEGKPVAQDAPSSIPAGGTTGQVLSKKSETDYDTEWKDATMVVTATKEGDGTFTGFNYTVAEMNEALRSGMVVVLDVLGPMGFMMYAGFANDYSAIFNYQQADISWKMIVVNSENGVSGTLSSYEIEERIPTIEATLSREGGVADFGSNYIEIDNLFSEGKRVEVSAVVDYPPGISIVKMRPEYAGGQVYTFRGDVPDGYWELAIDSSDTVSCVFHQAATLDSDNKVTASQASAAVVSISASTTLSSAHAGRFLSCTNADAITITIPTGIAAGTEMEIYRGGAGTVTLSPASGVTVECKESNYGIADRYTSVVLKWRTDSIVVLEGNVG